MQPSTIPWMRHCARSLLKFWRRLGPVWPDTAAPLTSRYHDERLEVIYAYVRCRIFTEPALTFLSQSYDCVMELLNDDNLDLVTLEKNWNAVKTLRVHDIRDAVDDVLRANKEDDYVMVLEPRFSRRPAVRNGFCTPGAT